MVMLGGGQHSDVIETELGKGEETDGNRLVPTSGTLRDSSHSVQTSGFENSLFPGPLIIQVQFRIFKCYAHLVMRQNGKLTHCIITCNKHQMTENDDLCPSAGNWLNKLGYFPTTEHHAPAKKKKIRKRSTYSQETSAKIN